MIPIPMKIRREISIDPLYKTCALFGQEGHECGGRITFEHAIMFSGKRYQTKWAIIPLCARGHEVDQFQDAHTMNKELNIWVALNNATDEELRAISKAKDYIFERDRLNKKYGEYKRYFPINFGKILTGALS